MSTKHQSRTFYGRFEGVILPEQEEALEGLNLLFRFKFEPILRLVLERASEEERTEKRIMKKE